jgi:hypothetical protein
MRFNFDDRDFIRARNALFKYRKKGVPHAARNGLNASAFEARKEWIKQVQGSMVLRNTWTTRSIRVTKARGTDMRRLEARVGSLAAYMRTQEDGGTLRPKKGIGLPIPTPVASREARGTKPRKRVVPRPNRMSSIQLANRARAKGRRQSNAATIREALASGRKFVFLDLEKRRGIFRIAGGKREPRFDLVWDLTRPSARIAKNPTLGPTTRAVLPSLPRLHTRALLDQLTRFMPKG